MISKKSVKTAVAPSSVIGRVTAVLGLFDAKRIELSMDDIELALGLSPASAYRYASELLTAGLLSRTEGRFRLGPKIIELEYLIRSYDPVIRAGHDLMDGLAGMTGCDVLLSNVYEETIVNVLHVHGENPVALTYTKGLPMPLFRGSQAHVMLAHMERRKLRRLYDRASADARYRRDVAAIGRDWPRFTATLRAIREAGYYVSRGELDRGVTGIAAPVFGAGDAILGSLVLAIDTRVPSRLGEETLIEMVRSNANEITRRIRVVGRSDG